VTDNLLTNGSFEADWGDEKCHWCLVAPVDAAPYDKKIGNIFTPPGWTTWFRHQPGTWDQPEVRDAWRQADSHRVRSGQKGMLLFTFFRAHDGGFMQKVEVVPGSRVRLSAWAHAWSNTKMEGHEDCYENSRRSCGVGEGAAFALEDDGAVLSGDPWQDAARNFSFYVGIDPTGATDPTADTVVWGPGAHIYNVHAQVPPVEAVAVGNQVTVYLRSRARWGFKHNDAYWDDAELTVLEPGPVVSEPEVYLTHLPARLKVGDRVTLEARSLSPLAGVTLSVVGPSGATLAMGDAVSGRDGDWYTWRWESTPSTDPGVHVVTLSAGGDVEVGCTFDCAPEVRLRARPSAARVGDIVTIEARSLRALDNVDLAVIQPSGSGLEVRGPAAGRDGDWYTWIHNTAPTEEAGVHRVAFSVAGEEVEMATFESAARAEEPEPAEERGEPRVQYERTYVLLPPDAGAEWAKAAIDGAWDRRRFTIGGSADDAGIGDLDARRVIAVNPGDWTDELAPFFDRYYPGVEYGVIEADTPEDLRREIDRL
jgi:hypothetical protein